MKEVWAAEHDLNQIDAPDRAAVGVQDGAGPLVPRTAPHHAGLTATCFAPRSRTRRKKSPRKGRSRSCSGRPSTHTVHFNGPNPFYTEISDPKGVRSRGEGG